MDDNTDASIDTTTDTTMTAQLPGPIRAFVAAHGARDADAALTVLTPTAVISDVGESFAGEDALRRFVSEAGAEYSYTDEITRVAQDGEIWVVSHHLEGDFPGGAADLDYRFALDGDRIGRLDIVLGWKPSRLRPTTIREECTHEDDHDGRAGDPAGGAAAAVRPGARPDHRGAGPTAESGRLPPGVGEDLEVRATVRNAGATRAHFAVDYVVHYRKARGPNAPKVFKMATVTLDPGESRELVKRRSFAPTSTRVLHPGPHSVELQVNGRRYGEARVELRAAASAERP